MASSVAAKQGMSPETVAVVSKLLQTVGGILLTVCMGLTTWGLKTAISNSDRITAIESNRFTVDKGLELWKEVSKIRQELAALPSTNLAVREKLDAVARGLESVAQRMVQVERAVDRIDGH